MAFTDQLKTDLAAVIDTGELSMQLTYTAAGGEGKVINALIFAEDADLAGGEQGESRVRRRQVVILTDATKGVAAPAIDDKLTIDGEDWRIEALDNEGHGRVSLTVVTTEPQTAQHEMHRRRID